MTSIETLKHKREEANQIVSDIKSQSIQIELSVKESTQLLKEIKVNSSGVKKTENVLNNLIENTNQTVQKFRSERDRISKLLTQVNSFYNNKYLPLAEKIDDKESGLKAVIRHSVSNRNETNKLKELSEGQYNQIKSYASLFKKMNAELKKIDQAIRTLHNESERKGLNISTRQTHVQQIEKNLNLKKNQLDKLFEKSKKTESEIAETLLHSNKVYNEIVSLKTKSEGILKDIQNIYEIAAETGLSGEFDKRRSFFATEVKKWDIRVTCSTAILFLIILLFFIGQLWIYEWDLTSKTFDLNFYVRFLLASPIVYYLFFCSNQYAKAKKLHDKYSFKTTLAMSIKQHIMLLLEQESFTNEENTEKILDFILHGFRKIYSEPDVDDDYKLKLKLSNMEIDIERKILKTLKNASGIDLGNKE